MDKSDIQQITNDIIGTTIGNFGKWQFRISVLMSLLKFPIAWFQLGIVFLAPPTQFWCKQPQNYKNMSVEKWLEYIKPAENQSGQHEGLQNGSCLMRDIVEHTGNILRCQWGYEYNRSVVYSSIITEWDLVCGKERLVDITQITLMLGVLIGNVICGVAADKFGRKLMLMICLVFQSFFGMLSAWSPCFWGFLIFRFLLAIANGGTMITSFVLCMEVVGGNWRTVIPILYQIPFGIGNSIMAGLAFLFRDWRELQTALSSLSALYIFYLWFVPESPRWLMAVGRNKEMVKVLENAGICNGLDPATIKQKLAKSRLQEVREKPKFSTLFSTSQMRKRTFFVCINWLICGITFYAFSQYLGQVSQNLFLTVAVGGLIAIPGTLLCVYVVGRCGRRWTIASAHLLTAVCFLAILAVPLGVFPHDYPRVSFAALGIIGMSISMPALYLFTGELYPTVIRNAGVGAAVMFSRIGSMLAPLVTSFHNIAPFLPLLTLGILATVEAILILPLPETKDIALAETLEDLKNNNEVMVTKNTEKGKYTSVSNEQTMEDLDRKE